MPVVFRDRGFKFHFYANEGNPREPMHIHVTKDGTDAKFWLHPKVHVAYNDGFSAKTLRQLIEAVEQHRRLIERDWNEFFRESD